jgi:MFS family permease
VSKSTLAGIAPLRRNRSFNLLWLGQAVSQFGDYLPYVSLPLFVKYLSDGTFAVALSYTLDVVPTIVVGFVGGAVIDRLRIHRVMIVTDLLRAAAFAMLAWMAASGGTVSTGTSLLAALSVSFVAGTLAATFMGALFAAIPRIVDSEQLAAANSRLAATQNVATVVGPATAGLLIANVGFWPTFAVNAVTFTVSAGTLAVMGPIHSRVGAPEPDNLDKATAGFRVIFGDPRLRATTVAVSAANLMLGFVEATFVIAFEEIGAREGWQQGVLFAVFGAGALAGSMLTPRMAARFGNGRLFVGGLIVFGSVFAAFSASEYGVLAGVLLFASFVGFQLFAISYTTIRQRYTPEHLLGRVATASRALAWSTLPLGALGGAYLSEVVGYGPMFRAAPIVVLLIGLALVPSIVWTDTD